ncbi:helix-turn-helix transcriptional regulator [bacterium]|nr:helix-turn-helix transcriptional regulator [bacterium]
MKTLDMSELGELVKNYRKANGLTQYQLAEIIDIDDKQLGKIERGVHFPSVPTFLKLIKVLNIDINLFYKNMNIDPVLLKENSLIHMVKDLPPSEIDRICRVINAIVYN